MERLVIDQLTVRPAAWLLSEISPAEPISADGPQLLAKDRVMRVLNGCDGVELQCLLMAGLLAAPMPWGRRLPAMVLGMMAMHVLNQLRLIGLFHALARDRAWFDLLHGGLAPLILSMAAGAIVVAAASPDSRLDRP